MEFFKNGNKEKIKRENTERKKGRKERKQRESKETIGRKQEQQAGKEVKRRPRESLATRGTSLSVCNTVSFLSSSSPILTVGPFVYSILFSKLLLKQVSAGQRS